MDSLVGSLSYAHLGHLSDPAEIVGFGCTTVRESLLAARPKITRIYLLNGLRFAEIRPEPAEKTYMYMFL
eukprot:COSAG01_NODE_1964_length_8779_cov_447.550922_6_plen_70_part_00